MHQSKSGDADQDTKDLAPVVASLDEEESEDHASRRGPATSSFSFKSSRRHQTLSPGIEEHTREQIGVSESLDDEEVGLRSWRVSSFSGKGWLGNAPRRRQQQERGTSNRR